MTISNLARSMRARMPWDVANRVLKSIDAPRSMGWGRTIEKLNETPDPDGLVAARLAGALVEHTLAGEKLVRFFELPDEVIQAMRDAALEATIPSSPFSAQYPCVLSDDELEAHHPQPHTLTAVEKSEDGIAVVFSSIRSVTVREEISKTDLPTDAQPALEYFDELYGLRHVRHQASDVIWIPHTGNLVDVRVDYPKGMGFELGTAAHTLVANAVFNTFGTALGMPLNLFPLIQAIYETEGEGRLVEFQFGTTTASLKHEKMRRAKDCLRKEAYHVGGKHALKTPLQPFKMSVEYKLFLADGQPSFPELNIHGNSRMTGTASPSVVDATIRKTAGSSDFEYIRDRIAHFLAAAKSETAA